jgi:hypothetical protein
MEYLAESVNGKDLNTKVEQLMQDKEDDEFSHKVNSTFESVVAIGTGAVIDAPTFVGGIAFSVAKTTGSVARGVKTGMAIDTAIDSTRLAVDKDYHVQDLVMDVPLNIMFNVMGARAASKGIQELALFEQNKIRNKELIEQEALRKELRYEELKDKYHKRKVQQLGVDKRASEQAAKTKRANELVELENDAKKAKIDAEKAEKELSDLKAEEVAKKSKKTQKQTDKAAKSKERAAREKAEQKAKAAKKKLKEKENKAAKRKDFFKVQDEIVKKAAKEEKKIKKSEEAAESNKRLKRENEIYAAIAKDMDEVVEEVKQMITSFGKQAATGTPLAKKLDDEINEIIENVAKVDANKGQELKNLQKKELGQSDGVKIHAKTNSDGTVTLSRKGKPIGKLPIAIAASITGSAVFADDGFGVRDGAETLLMLGAAGLLGIGVVKKFGGIKETFAAAGQKARDIYTIKNRRITNSTLGDEADRIVEQGKLDIMGTYNQLVKGGAEKLAKALLFNPLDAVDESAEIIKDRLRHGMLGKYATSELENFKEFLKTENISNFNLVSKAKALKKFRALVSDVVEGRAKGTINENVQKSADDMKKIFKEMTEMGVAAEVKGAGKTVLENYLPRLWNFNSIKKILESTDDAGRLAFEDAITKAIMDKSKTQNIDVSRATAKALIEHFNRNMYSKKKYGDSDVSDIIGVLKRQFGENIDEAAIRDIFITEADQIGRVKSRIAMNLNHLDGVVMNVNGVSKTLNLDDFVERDSYNIMQQYLNEYSGAVALARKSYKTEAELNMAIADAPPALQRKLMAVRDSILGRPLLDDPTGELSKFTSTVKNIVLAKAMPLITLSTAPELFSTLAKSMVNGVAFKQMSREIKNIMKKHDADDFMMAQWAEVTGRGRSVVSHDTSLRGVMDFDNIPDGVGMVEKASAQLRDRAIMWSQLPKVTDLYERVTLAYVHDALAKHIHGVKRLSDKRMKQYGITEKTEKLLSKHIKLSEKGNTKNYDLKDFSAAEKDELGKILNAMVNANIQRTSVGGTPLFFANDNLGRVFGTLMGFGVNAYSNLGLRGLYNRDMETFVNSGLWFAGAYMGVIARAAIDGREVSEEEATLKAFLNMPIAGMLGVPAGLMANPVNQFMQSAGDAANVYNANIGD